MSETYVSAKLRDLVTLRAKSVCEYCRNQSWFTGPFSIDHVMPTSKGGPTVLDNLAFACLPCNLAKGDRAEAIDPLTGALSELFNPRQHDWLEHFRWNDDCTLIVGFTAIGRTSVDALRLNRADAVHLRAVLVAFGNHPPES